MRKSRFTTDQIASLLHEHEADGKIADRFRRHGMSDNTFTCGSENAMDCRSTMQSA
jgi:hypothetical protein